MIMRQMWRLSARTVYYYCQPPILEAPRLARVNLHASLLPDWRRAPIQRAIMLGDARTGVDLMRMETGVDTRSVAMREVIPYVQKTQRGPDKPSCHSRRETPGERLTCRLPYEYHRSLRQPILEYCWTSTMNITVSRRCC